MILHPLPDGGFVDLVTGHDIPEGPWPAHLGQSRFSRRGRNNGNLIPIDNWKDLLTLRAQKGADNLKDLIRVHHFLGHQDSILRL